MQNKRTFAFRLGKWGLGLFIGLMSMLLFTLFLVGVVVGKHMEAYPERYAIGVLEMFNNRFAHLFHRGEEAASLEEETVAAVRGSRSEENGGLASTEGGATRGTIDELALEIIRPAPVREGDREGEGGHIPSSEQTLAMALSMTDKAEETPYPAEMDVRKVPPNKIVPIAPEAEKKAGEGLKRPYGPETAIRSAVPAAPVRYEVQVAAYREQAPANRLVQEILKLGYVAQVVAREIPERGLWFRVIVPGFESREKAREAADQLTGEISGLERIIRVSDRVPNGG
ncbi:MAG: SPOR domain-containing protein [Syntrophaceae bacterium]|nr:SPOR domain-containing protein [Syntrophaceae bacterium]